MTDETTEAAPAVIESAELQIPEFLRSPKPARFLVLVNKQASAVQLVKAPISLKNLFLAAEGLGTLAEVLIMVPQNPEGT